MQASSLSILVDEKRVNDLLKQKTGAKAFLRSACNLCAFIFFIVLFTVMALGEPLSSHRSFEAYLRHRFDVGAAMRLDEVNSIHDFYDYWNNTMIPGLFTNNTRQYTFPGAQVQAMLKIDGDKANNRLFGLVRVRTVKVKSQAGCGVQSEYESYFPECFGQFSADDEDSGAFGPISVIGGPAFEFSMDKQSKPQTGWLSSYPGGGFMKAIDANYSKAIEMIEDLKEKRWISPASRAIWFEFTIYNLNLGLYAVNRITFEISPVGGWLKTYDIDILDQRHLKPLGDGKLTAWLLLIMEAVLVIFVIRYLCEEASEFIGCDNGHSKNPLKRIRIKFGYFADGWNLIDWSNLILMLIVMYYRMSNWQISPQQLFTGTSLTPEMYVNFHDIVENVRLIRSLTAFNAVLTWFKAVKYINILPYISTFMETMALSWKMLVGWSAIFATTFMGFCLSYSTAFGESLSDFRTVPRAFVFLMRAFVGNAKMNLVYDANPVIGSMLTLMFVISMIFVNLNLFYAILISYMSDARQTQEMAQKKEQAKFNDKVFGLFETVGRVLQLQARFRSCFPGLWSRLKTWENQRMDLERKRDERMNFKAKLLVPDEDIQKSLGPASPNCGRRRKRVFKQELDVDADDDKESVAESEPDLGPLRFKEQLEAEQHDPGDEHHEHHHHDQDTEGLMALKDMPGGFGGGEQDLPEEAQENEAAQELVLEACEHIVKTITERCRGARNLVCGEMGEARQVLMGIGNVLEVLGRRARSLEGQQEQILPPELVARMKKIQAAEDDAYDWD